MKIFINQSTGLPTQLQTLEDDPVYGDALWQVKYKDWQQVDGFSVPTRLTHFVEGRLVHQVTRSSIELLSSIDDNLFTVSEQLKAPFNADLFAWGVRSSQWFGRYLLSGFPFDLDQSSEASINLVDIAPGVVHVRGFTHNTLVVEMKDYLVVIDPPLYEQRTVGVLKAIKQRWGNTPIKYIVASHFHADHIGGMRGYAAAGATLVVGEQTEAFFETMLEAKHTVYPDALSLQSRDVEIIEVSSDEPFVITDGERNIHLVDIPNRHSIGMLMPFIEDAHLAFVSDLYNPEPFPTPIPALFSFWSLDLLAALETSELDVQQLLGAHGTVSSYEKFVADVRASF